MHSLLEAYLTKKYPKIFVDMHGDPKKTCMSWGITCQDGWFYLIKTLCSSIQRRIDDQNEWVEKYGKKFAEEEAKLGKPADPRNTTLIPQVVAVQVKEKFGGLRFYYDGGDDRIKGLVSYAESLSYQVCEECGLLDKSVARNTTGWIRTNCRLCANPKVLHEHDSNKDGELVKLWDEVSADNAKKELETQNQ
jgi:hypothetical protein